MLVKPIIFHSRSVTSIPFQSLRPFKISSLKNTFLNTRFQRTLPWNPLRLTWFLQQYEAEQRGSAPPQFVIFFPANLPPDPSSQLLTSVPWVAWAASQPEHMGLRAALCNWI